MDVMILRIYRLGVVICLAVVVMVIACSGVGEPALPAETVAGGAAIQPANTLLPAPTATPVAMPAPTSAPAPALSAEGAGVGRDCNRDRDSLVELYNAAGGDNWRRKDNWLSGAPLYEWRNVSADSRGRVIGLYLHGNRLTGEIPPELGNLANLKLMDLSDNQLSGKIPPELGGLANLEVLHLHGGVTERSWEGEFTKMARDGSLLGG